MAEQVKDVKTETKICLVCHKAVAAQHNVCPDDGGELINTKQDRFIGEVFANRYKILSTIGQGGMSTVYKAQHTYMDRVVALKLLHPHLVSDPISVQRFQQEAKAAASLCHANVITVYDFGVSETGLAFLVMDYLEGPSLGDLLDRTGPVPPDEALDIFRQVAKGLCHAHKKGVVHRDLKPRNLVLAVDEDGSVQVKIVDFGIAKVIPQDGGESQHLTQTGEVFGSPIYMSPEQCSGQPLDARSDIYSLGCVMFEVLTGMPPFVGQNAVETMSMHVNDDPPPLKQISPSINVSNELEEVIHRCLAKNPKKRFQTAVEVLEALPYPGGMSRVGQTGTVAMKLVDMVKTQPHPLSNSKKPRKTKRHRIRISSKVLAIVFGALFFSLMGLISFFPFSGGDDPGVPLQKMWWQFELWLSDRLMEYQWPSVSVSVLENATRDARSLGGSNQFNYDAVIETLAKQADALIASGRATDQEAVVCQIVDIDRKRWDIRGKELLDDIRDSEQYLQELDEQGEPIQKHLSEYRLNWSGSVRRVVEVARRLDANYAYSLEYEILKRAEKLFTRLYGDQFPGVADIMEQRAVCLRNQDRLQEIASERLYEKIRDVRAAHAAAMKKDIESDPEYARAVLNLGQWQRDRNQIEAAKASFEQAIRAVKALRAKGEISADQSSEYYGSYADFLEQIKDSQFDENRTIANQLRKEAEQKCLLNPVSTAAHAHKH